MIKPLSPVQKMFQKYILEAPFEYHRKSNCLYDGEGHDEHGVGRYDLCTCPEGHIRNFSKEIDGLRVVHLMHQGMR